ncbi:ATP-grasp domain-containing protein [Pseudomonas simiae]|uniref:ATP-grasp domain-containing protein n=1 Tax=Pseudomonas simiae TaxID=321846 RepID=A0ABS9G611_9PSED|nr:hypothetical protein [Pseudomonas simiae]MCF5045875.1 hypothetical protein [Pseudomonas simiae]MCF5186626.1 hypothetical protein [Pseudomonas simiae]MCF5286274.1 hypothetical protein [Pseudomonas simiae]MCF5318972.1 hypothetical protein [Pseudomonas simiae]MCF5336524.1 hypothetical protein [Pseudomonas simiae]
MTMTPAEKPLVIIFTGANERAVGAFCRSLQRDRIDFVLITRNTQDALYRTRLRRYLFAQRTQDALDENEFKRLLLDIKASHPTRPLTIAPSAESINRLLMGMQDWLFLEGIQGISVSPAIYHLFSDKEKLLAAAKVVGLKIPAQIEQLSEGQLPFVLKPRVESGPHGQRLYPLLVRSAAEYAEHARHYDAARYLIQRYIDGQSFYYLYFRNDAGVVALYQRNIAQQAAGKSMVAAELVRCPDTNTDQRLRALLEQHHYCGFIMFEVMESAGQHFIIEANPRLWGPMQLALENGFRASWLVQDRHQTPQMAAQQRFLGVWQRDKYLWLGGFVGQPRSDMRFFAGARSWLLKACCWLPRYDIWFATDSLRLFFFEFLRSGKRQ